MTAITKNPPQKKEQKALKKRALEKNRRLQSSQPVGFVQGAYPYHEYYQSVKYKRRL